MWASLWWASLLVGQLTGYRQGWEEHLQINSKSQIEKCNLNRIEKLETHEGCDCIRQASEGFIKNSAYLIG